MKRKTDIALLATRGPTAQAALHDGRIAASVLEEDDLLLLLQGFPYADKQLRREYAVHHLLAPHLLYIDHFDTWQLHAGKARLQHDEPILAANGVVIGFQAWRGRTQQGLCPSLCRKDDGCVAGMISGSGFLLLEGCLVQVVDDDEPEPPEGEKDAAAHSHDDVVWCIGEHLLVEFRTFPVGIAGMIDANPAPEDAAQPFCQLGCQDDFRQHEEHLLPFFDSSLHEMDVDFRLATACYAVEQAYVVGLPLLENAVQGLSLRFCQLGSCPVSPVRCIPVSLVLGRKASRDFVGLKYAFLAEFAQDGIRAFG